MRALRQLSLRQCRPGRADEMISFLGHDAYCATGIDTLQVGLRADIPRGVALAGAGRRPKFKDTAADFRGIAAGNCSL